MTILKLKGSGLRKIKKILNFDRSLKNWIVNYLMCFVCSSLASGVISSRKLRGN